MKWVGWWVEFGSSVASKLASLFTYLTLSCTQTSNIAGRLWTMTLKHCFSIGSGGKNTKLAFIYQLFPQISCWKKDKCNIWFWSQTIISGLKSSLEALAKLSAYNLRRWVIWKSKHFKVWKLQTYFIMSTTQMKTGEEVSQDLYWRKLTLRPQFSLACRQRLRSTWD